MTQPLSHSITFRAYSRQEMIADIVRWLNRQGYEVQQRTAPQVTIGELARLVGRKVPGVSVSLRRPSCPPFIATRGASGRILRITADKRLIDHLTKP